VKAPDVSELKQHDVDVAIGADWTVAGEAAQNISYLAGSPDLLDGLRIAVVHVTVGETLYQAIELRSAVAHSYLPEMQGVRRRHRWDGGDGTRVERLSHWLDDPAQLFWLSDKGRGADRNGLSVQAGCARGVLALLIQLVDQVIVGLAVRLPSAQEREVLLAHRLPREWFMQVHPGGTRRGMPDGLDLWRGACLVRVEPDDLPGTVNAS
jgi:hypothetical protein